MVGDAAALQRTVEHDPPDAAIIDIRMPPTFTHDGAQAAIRLRERQPELGILLLSQLMETRYAATLVRAHPEGFGYLLKDRVAGVSTLVDAVHSAAAGGTVLDPTVVSYVLSEATTRSRYLAPTDREREVVELMAQGRSNGAISRQLFLTVKTVEGHIASIFTKLGLYSQPDDNRPRTGRPRRARIKLARRTHLSETGSSAASRVGRRAGAGLVALVIMYVVISPQRLATEWPRWIMETSTLKTPAR